MNNETHVAMVRETEHRLKIHFGPFADLLSGVKTGEVRKCDDRDFQVGDTVILCLVDARGMWAHKQVTRRITHIQRGYGLPDDLCVLSYAPADHIEDARAMVEQTPAVGGDLSKDHVFRELVNDLRDTAKKYSQTEQLRERISAVLRGHVAASESAARTLGAMGYTNNGGEFWKPPIGAKPDFSMMDRLHARIAELEAQQGEPVAWMVEVDGMTLHHREPMNNPRAKNTPLYLRAQPATAKVEQLEAQIAKANDWQHLKPDMDPLKP